VKQRISGAVLRAIWLGLVTCLAVLWLSLAPSTTRSEPVAVNLARSSWSTGDLQVEIVAQLIEELGYSVNTSQVFSTEEFYEALGRGDTDLWLDTWLPDHDPYIDRVSATGVQLAMSTPITDPAVQGYRIDLKTANALTITSIADFRDPKIAEKFDLDGNGKADLIGCNPGWDCKTTIDRHIQAYGLSDTVEQISDNYDYQIRQTIERYKRGEPVLFFTWKPHAVNRILTPDEKTRWLTVPEALPVDDELGRPLPKPIEDLEGCTANPCLTGFPETAVRPASRQDFLQLQPAIAQLLERVFIPIDVIETQLVARMNGEDTPEDLDRYAQEWIAANRSQVDAWLAEANESSSSDDGAVLRQNMDALKAPLRVVTKAFSPFVIYEDGSYTGFSIELWEVIAKTLGVEYRISNVNTVDSLLENVRTKKSDLGIAGISMTAAREDIVDFSHPFFDSGLQIMVRDLPNNPIESLVSGLWQILTTPQLYYGIGLFVLTLATAAHVIWFIEHKHNGDFPQQYVKGIWDAFWWSAVTVTTVGYGDKTPRTAFGKLFALVWMCAGYFVFAYFIATVTTSFTVDRLEGTIADPSDLRGKLVGTIDSSTAEEYLIEHDIRATSFQTTDDLYQALRSGKLEAIVYDAPVLQHYAMNAGAGEVELVGSVFDRQNYGIVLPEASPYREMVNEALLKIRETGTYDELYARWFGADNT
jgi:ABC-type proline/glycine betaine transport system substrate-binding protein/ABC-type amino acid transport substrate-binding protein